MPLLDTTLDFNHPLLESKTYEIIDSSYGKIKYRTLGDICFVKKIPNNWYENNYHPAKFFICYGAKSKMENTYFSLEEQKNLSAEEFKTYNTVTFSVLLEEDNKEWFAQNKEFLNNLPHNDSRRVYIKHKKLPIGESLDDFIAWHIVSLEHLDDKWKDANKEYIDMWKGEIKHQHDLFFEAVNNEDMKGIRKASARLVDLTIDNQKAMDIAIAKDNEQMVTYFIGKKFSVTREHLEAAKSESIKERLLKVILKDEKRAEKELNRSKKLKP